MKQNRSPRAALLLSLLLALLVFLLWAVGMYCATTLTAETAAERYLESNRKRADTIMSQHSDFWQDNGWENSDENKKRYHLWESVSYGNISYGGYPVIDGDAHFIERMDGYESFHATAVYEGNGTLVECSWEDFIYFEYLTEAEWEERQERSQNKTKAPFERKYLLKPEMLENGRQLRDAEALRFTGIFDGMELIPIKIEYIDEAEYQNVLYEHIYGQFTKSGVIQDYELTWYTLYENPTVSIQNEDLVTVYSDRFDVCFSAPSPSFQYNGQDYENLTALMNEIGPARASRYKASSRYEGPYLLIISYSYCERYPGGEIFCSSYHAFPEDYLDPASAPELQFYMVSAVFCSPWKTAFLELRKVYLLSFLFAGLLYLLMRSWLVKHLLQPVQMVNRHMEEDWTNLGCDELPLLRESQQLFNNYNSTQTKLRIHKNEINRLQTALNYAKEAEENRRQLTSAIAHELKTPLAVIQSYAEGLQERINEEKRDQYLNIILSECQRMDGMVLEMLDLSRLEAGKVKLARDEFSLPELARSIFDRLELALAAKELTVEYDFSHSDTVTADEGRIGQVITNFATNALKYTRPGGTIRVRTERRMGKMLFEVENTCEPLPQGTLDKLWDSFYRADSARSGEGTGLGLAICKRIIELHGGQISARNTPRGVAFRFQI